MIVMLLYQRTRHSTLLTELHKNVLQHNLWWIDMNHLTSIMLHLVSLSLRLQHNPTLSQCLMHPPTHMSTCLLLMICHLLMHPYLDRHPIPSTAINRMHLMLMSPVSDSPSQARTQSAPLNLTSFQPPYPHPHPSLFPSIQHSPSWTVQTTEHCVPCARPQLTTVWSPQPVSFPADTTLITCDA